MKTTIGTISSVQGTPKVVNLGCIIRIPPSQYSVRTIELTFDNGTVVPVVSKVNNETCYIELWSLTNAMRRAGLMHATDTLVSGGQHIQLVTGQQPFVAREGQEYDEILHADDYEEQDQN